jgi:hypothetical protein
MWSHSNPNVSCSKLIWIIWETFIWLQNQCSMDWKRSEGDFVDIMMCLIFLLTDLFVVHSECVIGSCRLTSIQCYWSLSHTLEEVSRLCWCVLLYVHLCMLWVWMCVVCVLFWVVCWFTHWHMVYSHISVVKWRYNQFLWHFILTHFLLSAAVPLRYQCGWETSIVPSRFTVCGYYVWTVHLNTNQVTCVSVSVTSWLCYYCH